MPNTTGLKVSFSPSPLGVKAVGTATSLDITFTVKDALLCNVNKVVK